MRTLILFLVLLAPNLTHATPGNGRSWPSTSFVAEGPFKIKVFINGRAVNYHPQHQVDDIRIRPGNHRVRIVAYGPRRTKEMREVLVIRPRRVNQFAIRSAGRRGALYLTARATSNHVKKRRDRLHESTHNVIVNDYCEDAQYFNVDRLADQMNRARFDGRKVQLAKNAIRNNRLFAVDLQYLLQQLTFDDAKVELAAFGFSRVCNTQDYYMVFEALSYQSSVRKLRRITGYY